jgi:drug/metabolite transporter (DMT)-like permease
MAPTAAPRSLLPLAAALVTIVLWSSAFVAIRHVGHVVSPGPLTLGRLLAGSVVLGLVMLTRRRPVPAGRHWPRLVAAGVLWFGVYSVALNAAERRIDAGTASMLVNIGPVFIAVMAGLFLGEGFPRRLLVGAAISLGGVAVITLASSGGSDAYQFGVLLCLLAAVSYSVAMVTQKPLLSELPGLQVTWLCCTIGAVVCLPFAPGLVRELDGADVSTWWWVLYLGVFPTAVGFTTWAYALARTSAGRLGVTTYLVPPVAILLSWGLLGETPAALALVGGALCVGGVYVSRRTPRPRQQRSDLDDSGGGGSDAQVAAPGAELELEPCAPGRS